MRRGEGDRGGGRAVLLFDERSAHVAIPSDEDIAAASESNR